MPETSWMIYGAYGYTGALVAEKAVREGHRPVLAGRSEPKLVPLAHRLGLDYVVVDLEDADTLTEVVAGVNLVYHAAGPFSRTSDAMIRACLAGGTHYLDITGEIAVFQNTFSYDEAARERGVVLISGAGFDVIATDCLAKYVADQVPGAVELETAIAAITNPSAGTTKSALEMMANGGRRRRDGKLVPYPFGQGIKRIRFSHGEYTAMPIPWADLVTAYRTTGIPNITSYMAVPAGAAPLVRLTTPVLKPLLGVSVIRELAQTAVGRTVQGPDREKRRRGRSYIWARASDDAGHTAQAWLETAESYQFTVDAGLRCVEKVLAEQPAGALTPALAFGADFVLEIEGTRRFDSIR